MTLQPEDTIIIRRVEGDDDLQRAFEIRRLVFLIEQKVPPEDEFDAEDATAIHVLGFVANEAVATARLILREDHARIGRMAVVKDHRGRGVGHALLRELIMIAREKRAHRILLHAQVHAIGFYESMGFRLASDVFDEAGIPHRSMELLL
jgi:predicted GNAT family N-acyltransferase